MVCKCGATTGVWVGDSPVTGMYLSTEVGRSRYHWPGSLNASLTFSSRKRWPGMKPVKKLCFGSAAVGTIREVVGFSDAMRMRGTSHASKTITSTSERLAILGGTPPATLVE